ncbi:hypothetical protein FOZ62_003202, partial [Perkinsus olseni]
GRWQKPSCGDWLRHIGRRLALSRHIPEPFRRCFQDPSVVWLARNRQQTPDGVEVQNVTETVTSSLHRAVSSNSAWVL